MLTVKHFTNSDVRDWIAIWSDQAQRYPEFLAPMTYGVLESQVLGNHLFDPNGVLIARLDDQPVGVIHASFGPNDAGTDISRNVGVIYPPVIRDSVPSPCRAEIAAVLIEAAERYYRPFGTNFLYAGGYANASPFYTGLYGWTNPQGICEQDRETVGIFRKMGYRPFRQSRRFKLVCAPYQPKITPKIQKVHREVIVQKLEHHTEATWWDANIYRNFDTMEWNVFSEDPAVTEPIAGAVLRNLVPTYSSRGFIEMTEKHFILEYIGVLETALRRGIASLLLTIALCNLGKYSSSFTVDTIADAKDTRLIKFLLANKFQETDSVRSFFKVIA